MGCGLSAARFRGSLLPISYERNEDSNYWPHRRHKYAVQIFECFWNTNFATVFVSGQNSSSALNLSGAAATGSAASGTPQYVTGTFVADSESASISLTSHTGYVIFDAMQVRDMGVPTAATPARN